MNSVLSVVSLDFLKRVWEEVVVGGFFCVVFFVIFFIFAGMARNEHPCFSVR